MRITIENFEKLTTEQKEKLQKLGKYNYDWAHAVCRKDTGEVVDIYEESKGICVKIACDSIPNVKKGTIVVLFPLPSIANMLEMFANDGVKISLEKFDEKYLNKLWGKFKTEYL